MPVKSDFKTCTHAPDITKPILDWRECYACIDEVTTQLIVARAYLKELAEGVFNEAGDMSIPVAEPIRGQHFTRIAATALGIIS